MTVSLPCRLFGRSLHTKEVRDNFLRVQTVCSKLVQARRACSVLEVRQEKSMAISLL